MGRRELGTLVGHVGMLAFIPRDSAFGAQDGGLRAARVKGGPARGSFAVWSSPASGEGGETDTIYILD
jgi:hypothetical protein